MQFELPTLDLDATNITAALYRIDANARVTLDASRGRLEVLSDATAAQVLGALEAIGYAATPLDHEVHISGGTAGCGHCA